MDHPNSIFVAKSKDMGSYTRSCEDLTMTVNRRLDKSNNKWHMF